MATGKPRKSFEDMTPEQQAKALSARAEWDTPEAREAEIRDRKAILEEHRATGTVAIDDDSAWPDDEIRLG